MPLNLQAVGLQESSPNMRGGVLPAAPVVIAAGGNYTVYDCMELAKTNLQYCHIQNVGVGVVKVCINDIATAEKYNRVLAVDTGADAGNGGVIEIPGSWLVTKISVFSVAGSKIAITLVTTKLNTRVVN